MSTAPVLPKTTPPDLAIRRWTVREYDRMGELGFLTPEDRVELLDGVIVNKEVNYPAHSGRVAQLFRFFAKLEQERWVTLGQSPVRLPRQSSEPEPDVVLARPHEDGYTTRHPGAADVFLLIEIANTSMRIDRVHKLALYARAKIPEYWVVVVPERVIETYRDPASGRYRETRTARPGETCAPAAFPDVTLNVGDCSVNGRPLGRGPVRPPSAAGR